MAKEISGFIKLQIKGGQANPAPPVGPALGQRGVNIMEFCKAFNDKTKSMAGKPVPVEITVYKDKKFDFIITVCDNANETCPVLPNSNGKKIHKNFTDPSKLNNGIYNKEFENERDQIKIFIIIQ